MDDRTKFAKLCQDLESPPHSEVMALGYMMRDWLESAIADGGTKVDQGAGMESFDLWVQVGGIEVYINLKEKKRKNDVST